jgi:hypothetical protein
LLLQVTDGLEHREGRRRLGACAVLHGVVPLKLQPMPPEAGHRKLQAVLLLLAQLLALTHGCSRVGAAMALLW